MTLANFIERSNIDGALIRAVVRKMGGWESFTQSARDIANHGIDGGFRGFIWHSDTVPFARHKRQLIMKMAEQQAKDLGADALEMIAGFGCLKSQQLSATEVSNGIWRRDDENGVQVLNALAWYAGEEVARSYVDALEQRREAA
jgi:hypothetical protein